MIHRASKLDTSNAQHKSFHQTTSIQRRKCRSDLGGSLVVYATNVGQGELPLAGYIHGVDGSDLVHLQARALEGRDVGTVQYLPGLLARKSYNSREVVIRA